jgi:hypothetical protein
MKLAARIVYSFFWLMGASAFLFGMFCEWFDAKVAGLGKSFNDEMDRLVAKWPWGDAL